MPRRILALDVGDARIGLAGSDETGTLASPLPAVTRTDPGADVEAIAEAAASIAADLILAGLPRSLDGSIGPQARKVQGFIRMLRDAGLTVETWDERFSTVEATRNLQSSGAQPSRDRGRLDSASAAVILQGYLDANRL
ncbi:MAG: Holliday junction resolvase RuvX [Chloroflexi bacterium]|nr:Holliday junction resolvase RuvX [Chloroflexota bacterium]